MDLSSIDVACGPPANVQPTSVVFSPTGLITCLLPNIATGLRQIHQIKLNGGAGCEVSELLNIDVCGELTLEEQLRCERMRKFSCGVDSFSWSSRNQPEMEEMIMIPTNGQLLLCCPGISLHCVYDGHLGVPIDPKWSPDGQQIAFVVNADIYVIDIPGNISSINNS